jgi:hypothetical protein
MTTKVLRVCILQRIVLVAAVIAALTIAGIPTAHAEFKTGRVCNAQGVCCVLTATGQIADCLIPGSPGMPGNPGQYTSAPGQGGLMGGGPVIDSRQLPSQMGPDGSANGGDWGRDFPPG